MVFTSSTAIIDIIKEKLGLNEKTGVVIKIWEKEFAPIFNYAELTGFRRGALLIEVVSSVHLQELNLQKAGIIKKINHYFGNEKVVKSIKLQIKK